MSPFDPNIHERLRRTGVEFLLGDVEAALTFVELARRADNDPEKKRRNQANARKAYDKIQELAAQLHLSPEEQSKVAQGLSKLKTELEALGEHF